MNGIHLLGRTLLDGDVGAIGDEEVDAGGGGADNERDGIVLGGEGEGEGADLVGSVAVGSNTVGPNDDGIDGSAGKEERGSRVGDHGGGDAVVHELIGGEAGTLQVGTGLGVPGADKVARGMDGADDTEGRAIPSSGERPGIAMGEEGDGVGMGGKAVDKLGSMSANGHIILHISLKHGLGALQVGGNDAGGILLEGGTRRDEGAGGIGEVDGGRAGGEKVLQRPGG
jgi:hypothetical protein